MGSIPCSRLLIAAAAGDGRLVELLLLLFLLTLGPSAAQSDNSSSNDLGTPNLSVNAPITTVIAVLVVAFFIFSALSLYIRFGAGAAGGGDTGSVLVSGLLRRQPQGLSTEVLETFPSMVYSEVKDLRIGKAPALECAVCLSEFEDSDTLRLLPACRHVFHLECVDPWFASHVTCPICRTNLTEAAVADGDPIAEELPASAAAAGNNLADAAPCSTPSGREDDRAAPSLHLAMDISITISQEQSTPDKSGEDWADRHTLRLPEHVLKDIISKRKLSGSASFHVVTKEKSRTRGRSARFGKSDRWLEIMAGTLSSRFPAMASERKGEGQSSADTGKFAGVRTPFDCLVGGGVRSSMDVDETMKAALDQRV